MEGVTKQSPPQDFTGTEPGEWKNIALPLVTCIRQLLVEVHRVGLKCEDNSKVLHIVKQKESEHHRQLAQELCDQRVAQRKELGDRYAKLAEQIEARVRQVQEEGQRGRTALRKQVMTAVGEDIEIAKHQMRLHVADRVS